MNRRAFRRLAIVLLVALTLALPALAQRGRRFGFGPLPAGVDYNGQFTIVRLLVRELSRLVVRLSGNGTELHPDSQGHLGSCPRARTAARSSGWTIRSC